MNALELAKRIRELEESNCPEKEDWFDLLYNNRHEIASALEDKARMDWLLNQTDKESKEGLWRIVLDYDNYQDGARLFDADMKLLSDCYDFLEPNQMFRTAIDNAIKKESNE